MALHKSPDHNDIIYGDMGTKETEKAVRWWTVINCIKDGIWKCRNLLAFKNVYKSPESVVKVGLSIVKDYIQKDRKKYSYDEIIVQWKIPYGFITESMWEGFR